MTAPYVSKRRKTAEEPPQQAQTIDCITCSWPDLDTLNCWKLAADSCPDLYREVGLGVKCVAWSRDGTRICMGGQSLALINNVGGNKLDIINLCTLPQGSHIDDLKWSYDSDSIITSSQWYFTRFDLSIQKHHQVKMDCQSITTTFWESNIIRGEEELSLFNHEGKLTRTFGFKGHPVFSIVCANGIAFVSYVYSQISSPDKSIVAYDLLSGAHLSNQLTSELHSYCCLRYNDHDHQVYGITTEGVMTRFSASKPFKFDKKFRQVFAGTESYYRSVFDVMRNYVVLGTRGKLIVLNLRTLLKTTIPLPRLSEVRDVKFHPTRSKLAYCTYNAPRGQNVAGVINLTKHGIHIF